MTKIMNRLISKLIFIVMLTFVVALGAVAMNVNLNQTNLYEANAWVAPSAFNGHNATGNVQRGGQLTWSTLGSSGEFMLNTGADTRNHSNAYWSSYQSSGNTDGDLKYGSNYSWGDGISRPSGGTRNDELLIDQGNSTDNRYCMFWLTIQLSPFVTNEIAAGRVTMTFRSDVGIDKGGNKNNMVFIAWGTGGQGIDSFSTYKGASSGSIGGLESNFWCGASATLTGAQSGVTSVRVGLFQHKSSSFFGNHMDLFGKNMKLTVEIFQPIEFYAGYVGYSSYSGSGSLNVFNQNLSNGGSSGVIGTNLATISTNAWCPPMQNSSSTGSAAFLTVAAVSVSDFAYNTPTAAVSVSSTGYSTAGQHTPATGIVAPSIGAVSVSDFSPPAPAAEGSGLITSVPTARDSFNAPSPSNASVAANGPTITMTAFTAKQPADAYRWKNPLTLTGGASLSNIVSQSYDEGWDYWLINKWKRWTISSSGTLPHSYVTGGSGAGADQMEIAFNTGGTDMHIIMPAGYKIDFFADWDSRIEVNGGGRVFIYLMGNNQITVDDGAYFGGIGSDGRPNLYFIAIGGNNYFYMRELDTRFSLYAPHGQLAQQHAGRNRIEYWTNNNDNDEMRGIVVADDVRYIRGEGDAFYRFYKSGLPNTIRFGGVDRPLNFFLDAPDTTNANYNWTNAGTIFG